jgi:cysteine synthase B
MHGCRACHWQARFLFLFSRFLFMKDMLTTQTKTQTLRRSLTHSLLQAVGNTPLLELTRVTAGLAPAVRVFAKAEWLNPSGSVKDRPAANIIRQAVEDSKLAEGRVLLDSTSGNMGISYAMLSGALGIPVTLAVPASASPERLKILRALGVDLHLSDALEGTDGAIVLAKEILARDPERYFFADQYNNDANWQAHYTTTGPEIWQQTQGTVTHFVVGVGTTGTLMGAGRFLREQDAGIKFVAFHPDLPMNGIEGLKHMPSAIKPGIYDTEFADETQLASTEEAHEMVLRLAREEGMFVGVSSGAAAAVALRVARQLDAGVVVTVFPDGGFKYLSQNFWGFTE